jgi:hypothetical protein
MRRGTGLLLAWLLLGLLWAQQAGFTHRIAHPLDRPLAWPAQQAHPAHAVPALHRHAQPDVADAHHEPHAIETGKLHDCAAYDAATLGGALLAPAASTFRLTAADGPCLAPLPAQPGSTPELGFRSRAPPLA